MNLVGFAGQAFTLNATSTPGNPILRAEHLGRVVNGKALVDDVSFELYKGPVLAISGPSGAGKSSLLRLLNRLDEPTSGTVYLEGIDYRSIPPRELRRRIGMVTQRPYLFPGTVEQNLRFGPAQRGEVLSQKVLEDLLLGWGSRATEREMWPTFLAAKRNVSPLRGPWRIPLRSCCSMSPHLLWTTLPSLKSRPCSKTSCMGRV